MQESSRHISSRQNPWLWIPSLWIFFALPFYFLTSNLTVFYKNAGYSNAIAAFLPSLFYLPWVIRALWSPVIEFSLTPRKWSLIMQAAGAVGIALLALLLKLQMTGAIFTIACFFVSCIASSQETAADGFFLQAIPNYSAQSFFVGVRSTFFRIGMLFMQGFFIWQVGRQLENGDSVSKAWSESAFFLSLILLGIFFLHLKTLPKIEFQKKTERVSWESSRQLFRSYFARKEIWPYLAYILFYRLGESQLLRLESPFFLDPVSSGGLGLSTKAVGILVGTVGPFALSVGGIATGYYLSKKKLEDCLIPMCLGMNIPNALFLWMALHAGQLSHTAIALSVGVEQFFYGFGFASFIMVVIEASRGAHRTAYYSISAGIMAIGMMVPGSWSGVLQEKLGYPLFFGWVLFCTIPSLCVSVWARTSLMASSVK